MSYGQASPAAIDGAPLAIRAYLAVTGKLLILGIQGTI